MWILKRVVLPEFSEVFPSLRSLLLFNRGQLSISILSRLSFSSVSLSSPDSSVQPLSRSGLSCWIRSDSGSLKFPSWSDGATIRTSVSCFRTTCPSSGVLHTSSCSSLICGWSKLESCWFWSCSSAGICFVLTQHRGKSGKDKKTFSLRKEKLAPPVLICSK